MALDRIAAFMHATARSGVNVKAQHFFFSTGASLGSFGQLSDESGAFRANFDVNYTPISAQYPSSSPGQYVVQTGETLRGIAARLFGDPSLWYVIAEENGLTDPDAVLDAGTLLRTTNKVVTLSNASGSFKPFDTSEALGDTTPTQPMPPPPKKKGCGLLGQIIVLVIAIVVTIYTAGAAATAMGSSLGSLWTTGVAAVTGSGAVGASVGITAAAIGGAVGSAVSQGVAIALDMQDEFSWQGVALSAIGSGVGSAVGVGQGEWFDTARTSVTNNMVTQGIGVLTDLQEHFDWRSVAASAIAGPLSGKVGGMVGEGFGGRVAAGITSSVIRQAIGGRVDASSVLVDAFGNALGNSIVEGMAPRSASARVRGGALDELQEVQITARYIGPDAERANARLDNNPVNLIYQPAASKTPDEVRAAEALAASPSGVIETVVSTAPQWRPGEMLIYQELMTEALIRGQIFNEDYASAQAQDGYRANMRRQADNFLIDTFTPYGHGKNAAVGLINLGIKAYGGLRGLDALRYGADMQTAAAVVEGFNSWQIDVDAPFAMMVASSLAPTVNEVRAWSEDTLGMGGSTILGAAAEAALDTLALVGAGAAARRFSPELDIVFGGRRLDQIAGLPSGLRPDPTSYLSPSYIESHLAQFDGGASYLTPKAALDRWGRNPVGRADGQFVMPSSQLDEILLKSNGNMAVIETELGIPVGSWQGREFVRIDVPAPRALDLRMPSGNESGANPLWQPGGRLPTGYSEAVVNPIPGGAYAEQALADAIRKLVR